MPESVPQVALSNSATKITRRRSAQLEDSSSTAGNSTQAPFTRTPEVALSVALLVALFTTEEAAALAGVTEQAIRKAISDGRLDAEPYEIAEGRHKGRKAYRIPAKALFSLYPHARRAWELKQAQAAQLPAEPIAAPAEPEAPLSLKDWQRSVMDARLALLRYLEDQVVQLEAQRATQSAVRVGQKGRAIQQLVVDAERGQLPEEVQKLIPTANARGGKAGGRTLSTRTLERWLDAAKTGLDQLAPKAAQKPEPWWARPLLEQYRQPQKPSLAMARELLIQICPANRTVPSYDAAWRHWQKIGEVEKERGRLLPRELKTLQPFVRRDISDLLPLDVLTADGHTFDAEVAHPVHGRPFRPEITTVMDIATRRIVGWSVGLAEAAIEIVDAMRHAVLNAGLPAVFYTDNGPGYINGRMVDLCARTGITHTTSIPYNSQARGVIERAQRSVWVELTAKRLPTYMGKDMDRQARQIVYKATRKGEPGYLLGWFDFLTFIGAAVEAYNSRAHSTLKGQSPAAKWQAFVDGGWTAQNPAVSLVDFMPQVVRQVARGELSLFGQRYFSKELAEYHGDKVRVAFDVHDATKVRVLDLEGRYLGEALFEANSRAYFPKAFIEQARDKRERGRMKRLQSHADEVRAERQLEVLTTTGELTERELELAEGEAADVGMVLGQPAVTTPTTAAPTQGQALRPKFADDREWALWVRANPELADASEAAELEQRLRIDIDFRLWVNA